MQQMAFHKKQWNDEFKCLSIKIVLIFRTRTKKNAIRSLNEKNISTRFIDKSRQWHGK